MAKSPSSSSKEQLLKIRHSAEHVLMYAMQQLYGPEKIIMAMGPATADGFYFDFDSPAEFELKEEKLKEIQQQMHKLIKQDLQFKQLELPLKKAREVFAGNPYKQEWLDQIEANKEPATVYLLGTTSQLKHDQQLLAAALSSAEFKPQQLQAFIDLCKGPHVSSTKEIKAVKLLSIAGAYWHGDEKNKMLTRVYGTAFGSKDELDHYLWQLEEAKKRDHRKISQKLGLFMFDDEFGQGLPLYKPNGAILRKQIMDFAFDTYLQRGYKPVSTPHIARLKLWQTSGHWNFYRDSMYSPIEIDDEKYMLKPMNCPGHVKIYNDDLHSYRDLPLRLAEMGTVYRYEKSGELNGILRPRAFTQDDAHVICTPEQLGDELLELIDLTEFIYSKFGFKDPRISLSVRDPQQKDKYLGEDDRWALAEQALEAALKAKDMTYQRVAGEAAFYGPKIDFMYEDALGREQQLTTIQVDFNLPEKFEMTYVDQAGERQKPFMLHRALLGSLERFMGVLIEHTAGDFPVWLAPLQVKVLPITDDQLKYAKEVAAKLHEQGIRVEVDTRSATLGAKIREAEQERVPYMLVVGGREQEAGQVAVRARDQQQQAVMLVEKFVKKVVKEVKEQV